MENLANDSYLVPYFDRCNELSTVDGCILWGSRVVIPKVGREKVIGASLSEPHIYVKYVNSVCLSVYLSVGPYVYNTTIYKRCANLRSTFNC